MVNHEEKRQYVRMNVETELTYTIKGSDITHHGQSADLSATGLHMLTRIAPAQGDLISVVMIPSNERLPPFEAEGVVVRVAVDNEDTNLFHVSIKLTATK